jgi:hypothetical protein
VEQYRLTRLLEIYEIPSVQKLNKDKTSIITERKKKKYFDCQGSKLHKGMINILDYRRLLESLDHMLLKS